MADWKWILPRAPSAWDSVFNRAAKSGCWVIIELNDGTRVGGKFGSQSFASGFPNQGELYLEELWELDPQDFFIQAMPGRQGLLLRSTDYKFVRVTEEIKT